MKIYIVHHYPGGKLGRHGCAQPAFTSLHSAKEAFEALLNKFYGRQGWKYIKPVDHFPYKAVLTGSIQRPIGAVTEHDLEVV